MFRICYIVHLAFLIYSLTYHKQHGFKMGVSSFCSFCAAQAAPLIRLFVFGLQFIADGILHKIMNTLAAYGTRSANDQLSDCLRRPEIA